MPEAAPLDLRILGRTLLHAAVVGLGAGIVGALFFAGLELVQRVLLELLCGYVPLRAHGEKFLPNVTDVAFRPWLLWAVPALGALAGGWLTTRFAPECRGGGGDAAIEAFHHQGGFVRRRVLWVKGVASMLTLGSGGSGGREGPTMHIGAALGSLVAEVLRVGARERRILLVAGIAAGMSAVFRTPLGAALLAVEVLYRDDFESDALIPAVLASVVAYSVVISIFGEETLFAHAAKYAFVPLHLPLYGVLAVLVAFLASGFVALLRWVQRVTAHLPLPVWARPGCGGVALGIIATPLIILVGLYVGVPGQGLGVLGGGYGAAQLAVTGSHWVTEGTWLTVGVLVLLCAGKMVASALTIGSGGSAGDFAPSLVIGALFGGAFGRVVALVLGAVDLGAELGLEPRLANISRELAALDEADRSLLAGMESGENDLRLGRRQAAEAEKSFLEHRAGGEVLQEKLRSLERQAQSLARRRETTRARILAAKEEVLSSDEEENRSRENIKGLEAESGLREEERLKKEALVAGAEKRLSNLGRQQEELEERITGWRRELENLKEERVKKEVGKAEVERDLVNLEEACWQELKKTLQEVKAEIPAEKLGGSEVEEELEQAKEDLLRYKAVNLMAEEEYLAQKERYEFLAKQRDDLRASISDTKEAITKIDQESKTMFLAALAEVNRNFQQVFTLLFNGGAAEVKLTDPEMPMDSGVDIAAQPPGKKLQSLTLLSGGEKSLTSLAFLFALFRYKPTPFCILDEVDAALDEVNLSRFLELMKKLKTETQFIIVTHNYKTMEVADYIYGTTMSEPNITNVYSVKLEKKEGAAPVKEP